MKFQRLLTPMLLVLFMSSMLSIQAYTPQDDGHVEALIMHTAEDDNNIFINSIIDFYVVIRNLTPNEISNITITQKLPEDADLISIWGEELTEMANFTNKDIQDSESGKTLSFRYLNTSTTEFMGNLEITLGVDDYFVIQFSVNMTEAGTFEFERPTLSYFDYWGDEYSATRGLPTITLRVKTPVVDPLEEFFPKFSTSEPNYTALIGGLIAILIVALLGRMAYFNKPFEL